MTDPAAGAARPARGLSWQGTQLLRNGVPHRILSGAMHYFRVHPDLWNDRLKRARAMGLNTVETYVAWNFHQPVPGETISRSTTGRSGQASILNGRGP